MIGIRAGDRQPQHGYVRTIITGSWRTELCIFVCVTKYIFVKFKWSKQLQIASNESLGIKKSASTIRTLFGFICMAGFPKLVCAEDNVNIRVLFQYFDADKNGSKVIIAGIKFRGGIKQQWLTAVVDSIPRQHQQHRSIRWPRQHLVTDQGQLHGRRAKCWSVVFQFSARHWSAHNSKCRIYIYKFLNRAHTSHRNCLRQEFKFQYFEQRCPKIIEERDGTCLGTLWDSMHREYAEWMSRSWQDRVVLAE